MTTAFALIVFSLQAVLMVVDEVHFHRSRGLPKWERIGHPVDTLSVFICFALALFFDPTRTALFVYVALAVFSCLLVTKDEGVHAQHCSPMEHWLHSLLFILHPLVLIGAGLLWFSGHHLPLIIGACSIGSFGVYQALYWNLLAPPLRSVQSNRPDALPSRSLQVDP
jgi:hypothetical protein